MFVTTVKVLIGLHISIKKINSIVKDNNMTEEQKRFIEMYSFEKKTYSKIEEDMKCTRAYLRKLLTPDVKTLIKDIQDIRTKFTPPRKEAFKGNFKNFYDWYKDQKQECGYCGITQADLKIIFVDSEDRILPFIPPTKISQREQEGPKQGAFKRSSGTLEIERLDSAGEYDGDNMILACPLCNNAKSNLIDEICWRELFVPKMQEYYKRLLNDEKCTEKCEHSK
jgi:hypothetical protein